jgi:hypothetical protein
MRRLVVTAASAIALVVAAASCSVGGDNQLQQIDRADLFGLDETTTTSTSTTIASTLPPPSSVESTIGATSTTIATESVELYFLDGSNLQDVSIDLAGPVSPSRVVTALLSGPPSGAIGIGLRSLLPRDLVNSVVESGAGYATVDLANDPFQLIDPADQRAAIAQLVMTLVNRPGIGQVRFTLDGVPMRVPRRDGLQSEPGEVVSLLDYESLLGGVTRPTTTPPTTTTPPDSATSVPAAPPGG